MTFEGKAIGTASTNSTFATTTLEEGLEIVRNLVALDVSVSLNKIGNMKLQAGDANGALVAYEESLKIRRKLVALNSSNTQWQSDMVYSLNRVASAAGEFAYYSLFDKNFIEAERKSREAIELNPEPLWLKTNLAHALMFQGKLEEAKEIYLKYRGEKTGDQSWEEYILADFKKLKSRGISHPLMAEIEELFLK